MRHSGYLLACVLSLACSTVFATENDAQTLLAEGDAYFTGGQINQALNSFDAAIRKFSHVMFEWTIKLNIETPCRCGSRELSVLL